ncbi:MAG: hypothetical protein CGU28_04220 [Candidatus Dactylopiibacterium carminicum]|uniref:Uncharacterized protein n=1 Tax=Candidatus Dactylopiibacterium carminicum TaxID=857335 RepID=A0A272EXH6_9RHOO|nr:hypothetical protein [Candidatus Dactylopiibacterium carminicum]KAF7600156.1 hypothetical protein BGI27_03615 [Candidatus Dactylopiibacterium carminicum]PAS94824.1 MAG: hypothetical protein CGU29_02685 [Candidatus Dactylopiibacterium carminicum]PAS97748.1 MAG: hypothetical protein CGU28_04220 [Candidatus Dactylopiibacterium carminicum]PAT00160.1 MAG: hypothetical protein BSR46_03640 [Candidatus Dactylopiibacterium carminicum]
MILALRFFIWMILLLLAVFGAMCVILVHAKTVPDNILWGSLLPSGSAPGVPSATGLPAGEDATSAATDTDVGHWAADAKARYAKCAERLNALIDFHHPEGEQ